MKRQVFKFFDSILSISFFEVFNLARVTNSVQEGAALLLLHFFMKHPSVPALNTRTALKSKSHMRHMEGTGTSYCEADKSVLKKISKDDVITETDVDMVTFSHPSSNHLPNMSNHHGIR